jgi:hypothetical protein
VRHVRVDVTQTWLKDGLYGDTYATYVQMNVDTARPLQYS